MDMDVVYKRVLERRRVWSCSLQDRQKTLKFCEVLVLTLVMVVIVGLYSIPTLLYAVPPEAGVRLITMSACGGD